MDLIHFPVVQSSGEKMVMMTAGHLVAMFERARGEFGSGGAVVFHDLGRAYGESVYEERRSMLGKGFSESNLKEALGTYQAMGWFRFEEVRSGGDTFTLRVSGNFECEGKRSPEPASHFVRGHLSGAMTALLGRPMKCEEAKCLARGDRYCEFVLTPAG